MRRSVLMAVTITSFMTPFTLSSVNVALPLIAFELKASTTEMNWIATSFLISSAIFLIPFGRLADIRGRKSLFITGTAVFSLASLLAAFSSTPGMLIAFRFLQGIGGAMIFSTGIAMLTSAFPQEERGKVLGINTAAVYTGLSAGPFVGGMLTSSFGWKSVFLVTFIAGVFALAVSVRKIKTEWAEAEGEGFDYGGSLLYGMTILFFTLGASERHGQYMLLLSLLSFLAFFVWERRQVYPVVDLKLFTSNLPFALSNLSALLNYSATFALTYLLSVYLQLVRNLDPGRTGAILVAQPIVMALLSPLAGWLSDRIEPRYVASLGMLLNALGLFMFSGITANTAVTTLVLYLAIMGTGFALFSSPNTNAVMSSVERRFYGVASATLSTMRVVGQTMSMVIVMLVFSSTIGTAMVSSIDPLDLVRAMGTAFTIFAGLCTLGIFTSLFRGNIRQ
ncbi:MFS transporter [Geoglobus acetivorans]|uniref:Efflux pump antibiotic resistance protein n=1 Tax=Geoglobus acetivorans TaxID=565033 RepID=A0A0A7GI59_GEOAI|nr:Efflux pump antibiotic resistance protein [Geoglobus acetivorans]